MSNYIQVKPTSTTGWQRPSDWLTMPSVVASEEVFYGLYAIWDTTFNPIAISCSGTGAGYTVDWGDGTINDYSFGVKAERNYIYSNIPIGTLSSRGYKQVIVKVTLKAGATISTFDILQRHSLYNYQYRSGWLDVYNNYSNVLHGNGNILHLNFVEYIYLKQIKSSQNLSYMFPTVNNLVKIEVPNFTHTGNASNMFTICENLKYVLINMSQLSSMQYIFQGAYLEEFSTTNFTNLGDASIAFIGVGGKIPVISSAITNASSLFNGAKIYYIPSVNLSSCTNMTNWIVNIDRKLTKILAYGCKISHTIANQLLDADNINLYFTNLGTANVGATITITGNPGASTCTLSIATLKGWTVIN